MFHNCDSFLISAPGKCVQWPVVKYGLEEKVTSGDDLVDLIRQRLYGEVGSSIVADWSC